MRKVTELAQWVEEVTGEDSWRTIAEKLHTTHATIKRRLTNHEADAIVELARAYDLNPISGLLAAGIITVSDVKKAARTFTVKDMTDVEIAQIIVDRLEAAERRSKTTTPDVESMPDDWMPEDAVADDSPEEGDGMPDDYLP